MDSNNPYSHTEGFVNVLTSQLVNEVNTPTIDLGSSELLMFSTQGYDDPNLGGKNQAERRKWSPKEDLVLISAWLNSNKDPVVGTDQKTAVSSKRIVTYFNSSPQLVGQARREVSTCKQRWGRINDHMCKFSGSYEAAVKEKTSGQNENDVMQALHDIFYKDYKMKFTLEHAWRELCFDQKWCKTSSAKDNNKRRKCEEGSAQSLTSQSDCNGDDISEVRLQGIKAGNAKAKMSNGVKEEGKGLSELQSLWGIKKQDLALKNKISDKRLLESLLAKAEPLSEIELTLKNKLLNELLSSYMMNYVVALSYM
ncbi:glutathione S-transferase T3-like [Eutrema salsugineum]|uniref:glutathione S-transferase T3-like n=1 Tax=Eutrema salsugineum TaxID=72664 RepID=UPI000CED33AE|nr:glutathione S-transferase T3-like [Eutrema salsugineum]